MWLAMVVLRAAFKSGALSFVFERARKRVRARHREFIISASYFRLDFVCAGKSYHDSIDVGPNWRRLNHFRSSGASILRKRRANSRFFEIAVSAVCWFFFIWLCACVPLKDGSRYIGGVQV
jgi:hypothetical protein